MTTAEANTVPLREIAEVSHAWPFEEARKIVARLRKKPKDEVIFETGYGPSGLPHIGTFGEVARTTMVRHAFRVLTDDKIKTRLIAFSDDMDGLRKVPDNVPNKEMLAQHLGKPLTKVPDPFGTHQSFAEHNNARLRSFLDHFGFDYEFMSSTACYTSGRFDAALLKVLAHFEAVMAVMLPSLREERAQTYSPFLPIDPNTGIVLQVPVDAHDAKAGTITYENGGERVTAPVTGGRCKLQWKPDWAMRWVALGVDYEMAGKDLIDSVKLSGEICRTLDGLPPEGFNYELFLDEYGRKISKSKGNGLTIEEWLRYASPESLSLFMYREPKAAKRLYFDVIPRHVDEYQQFLDAYPRQAAKERLGNPVWHIHSGNPPKREMPVTFQLLLTLVSSSNAENTETLWNFIARYRPGITALTHPELDSFVKYAINYYRDFVAPKKNYREPSAAERSALMDLRDALSQLPANASAETIQDVIYEVGRREPFLDLKKKAKDGKPGVSLDWFNMLYQVLLGQERGPRFGTFVAAYGVQNTIDMVDGALVRKLKKPPTRYRPTVIFACDESGSKGYANRDEAFPGEVGVIAGILVPEEVAKHAAAAFDQIYVRYKPKGGKLHIADIPIDQKENLRRDVFAAIQQLRLPCFWYAIHVAGLHDWHKRQQEISKSAQEMLRSARQDKAPRVKGGSPRSKPTSMHVELFSGLYAHLIAFLEERRRKDVDIEVRTDRVDYSILKNFVSAAKQLLSTDPVDKTVTGFDTVTRKLVEGRIRIATKIPPSMHIHIAVRSLTIVPREDGLVLAADVLANSLNHLFTHRDASQRYTPLNTPAAISNHPLCMHLDSFRDWGAGDLVGDRLYRHPKARR